jgi:hypothetical protein
VKFSVRHGKCFAVENWDGLPSRLFQPLRTLSLDDTHCWQARQGFVPVRHGKLEILGRVDLRAKPSPGRLRRTTGDSRVEVVYTPDGVTEHIHEKLHLPRSQCCNMPNMESKSPASIRDEQPPSEKSEPLRDHSHGLHGVALTGQAHLYRGMLTLLLCSNSNPLTAYRGRSRQSARKTTSPAPYR